MFEDAFGTMAAALVPVIASLSCQIEAVEAKLTQRFDQHPDAELYPSLPELGHVLGARALAEFGDAPDRYTDAKARRNYASAAPITRQLGTTKSVSARVVSNRWLFDACWQWSLCALSASPGARAYYDAHNPGKHTSKTARRNLATNSSASLTAALTLGPGHK